MTDQNPKRRKLDEPNYRINVPYRCKAAQKSLASEEEEEGEENELDENKETKTKLEAKEDKFISEEKEKIESQKYQNLAEIGIFGFIPLNSLKGEFITKK